MTVTTHTSFLLDSFAMHSENEAIIHPRASCTFGQLRDKVTQWRARIRQDLSHEASIVSLVGDFTPETVAAFLALAEDGRIIVPFNRASSGDRRNPYAIAQVEAEIAIAIDESASITHHGARMSHPHFKELHGRGHAGLVLFTSGTSGEPKGIVHDLIDVLEKFKVGRPGRRTVNFLLFDHMGGINTLLHALSNGGTVIAVEDRMPDAVCAAIECHRAEVLPTSPTFLNLLLLSEAHARYDLSTLRLITYGTEPMSPSTLTKLRRVFPNIELLQTYGLAELGVLRSRSKDNESLWMKVGGEGFETRVVDGILHVRARSAMIGYLNAPDPFTDDGWLVTGDAVEVDGDYIRILGRRSELINVGGQKVYPAQVEGVIEELDNVATATVYGEANPITGNIVCARVSLIAEEDPREFAARLKKHCLSRLENYQVPVRVKVADSSLYGERFKKLRN
jgi:acyl-coenzyme A synthetase/AMP-(fatty) acid ligase